MAEQDLRRDPKTGWMLSDTRFKDAHQNDNYVRHTDPAETSRDYSRPHTIPPEEFEATTGESHAEAVEAFEHNEQARADAAEKAARGK